MSPEEHFRRLQRDDVWQSTDQQTQTATSAATRTRSARSRGPLWTTAVVAGALIAVTVFATQATTADPRGAIGARAATTSDPTSTETATPTPTATDPRSADPSDPSLRIYEFDPHNPADMARAKTIIACFKDHGVRLVSLQPFETPGKENIGFGGPQNDHESITKGLKYSDLCFKAGGKP